MITEKVIDPATNKWVAHFVLALSKGGWHRLSVNYQKPDAVTILVLYPLP